MRFEVPQDVTRLAELIDAKIIGNKSQVAYGINEIHKVTKGDITFVDVEKYYKRALSSEATIILINKEIDCPEGKTLLVCDEPFTAFNTIVNSRQWLFPMVSRFHESIVLGEGSLLEHNVVVGENVTIGKNCLIRPNVVIYPNCTIGDNVIIHANTTIGADAFYFKNRGSHYEKLETCGEVIIENDVEIGSGCTIDRGVSGKTFIGAHTKIDNQVHIGHGVEMGKRCLIAAQVGIGGKTLIGDDVKIWGQVGIKADVTIGDGAVIYAGSGVSRSLDGEKVYFGAPAMEMGKWKEQYIAHQRAIRPHLPK